MAGSPGHRPESPATTARAEATVAGRREASESVRQARTEPATAGAEPPRALPAAGEAALAALPPSAEAARAAEPAALVASAGSVEPAAFGASEAPTVQAPGSRGFAPQRPPLVGSVAASAPAPKVSEMAAVPQSPWWRAAALPATRLTAERRTAPHSRAAAQPAPRASGTEEWLPRRIAAVWLSHREQEWEPASAATPAEPAVAHSARLGLPATAEAGFPAREVAPAPASVAAAARLPSPAVDQWRREGPEQAQQPVRLHQPPPLFPLCRVGPPGAFRARSAVPPM